MKQNAEEAAISEAAGEQPFNEMGAAALLAAPNTPTISNSAARNRELVKGVNLRDLHSVSNTVQPGRVYRSSQVVSASELELLGVSAVLDLRQPPVLCKTHHANLWGALKRSCLDCLGWLAGRLEGGRYARRSGWPHEEDGNDGLAAQQEPCCRCTAECCEHYGIKARVFHVDLLAKRVSLQILWEMPHSIQAKVLWAAARRKHPEPIMAGAVADPQVMGYMKLYHILLEQAKPRLADALRLLVDRGNYPLLMHCIHGKDRTGLVAMLLLLLCGVEREAVVRDYALSEVFLRESREKRELLGMEEHLTTDQIMSSAAQVMESTVDHIDAKYGSTHNYLKALGLSEEEMRRIVENMTQPGLPVPATAATDACERS